MRHGVLVFLLLLLMSARVPAEILTGRIVGVSDGDKRDRYRSLHRPESWQPAY